MAVLPDDLKLYGTLNGKLGGAIDLTDEIDVANPKHNIFDEVTAAESHAGLKDYRCIYIKNESATSKLKNAMVFIEIPPTDSQVHIYIGRSPGKGTPALISTDQEVPAGVAFQRADDIEHAVQLGNIGPGDSVPIWLKRSIEAGSKTGQVNIFVITVLGDTD